MTQAVVPSVAALQGVSHIQAEVDRYIRHLTNLNEAGKLKSQRGGSDTIFVKRQVPWPQNFVLGGGGGVTIKVGCLMTILIGVNGCQVLRNKILIPKMQC